MHYSTMWTRKSGTIIRIRIERPKQYSIFETKRKAHILKVINSCSGDQNSLMKLRPF